MVDNVGARPRYEAIMWLTFLRRHGNIFRRTRVLFPAEPSHKRMGVMYG